MGLRCFLFSGDEGTSDTIRQVMTALGVEGESCSQAPTAVDKVTRETFQLVIIDWDQQPEADLLLQAARERKAAERPLTLAIVSDDTAVPKALQAGANSILRKPLLINQVTDTLTTARDLLRSRQEAATSPSQAAAAAAVGGAPASTIASRSESATLRAGEFLQSAPVAPGGQFETDSDAAHFPDLAAAQQIDTLKDLEPVAASVANAPPVVPPPPPDEPRGLEYYLKARGVVRQQSAIGLAPQPAPAENPKPQLLGYDQTSSSSREPEPTPASKPPEHQDSSQHEKKQEAMLFSYITGDGAETAERPQSGFRIGKTAIIVALILACCGILIAPQAPWHPKLVSLTARGRRGLHAWLNPQPVTAVTQAPASHEDFGRPGDEYKLPVAENIPDATTDPAQISVVPVVDPTVKKPPVEAGTEQPAVTPDATATTPADGTQTNPAPTTEPAQTVPDSTPPSVVPASSGTTNVSPAPAHIEVVPTNPPPAAVTAPPRPVPPAPRPQTEYTSTPKVPSSLKSQIATMVPDASGNKPPEAALPSIEPVNVPELTERALLIDQPTLAYPASATGKQGTVTLQVLIGRDGTVQDAKFLQGSLAFARVAIDNVRQWKFKPYTMNGRAVSVATTLNLKFAPPQ